MVKYIISTSGNEIEIARFVSLLGLPTEVKDWIEAHKEPLFYLSILYIEDSILSASFDEVTILKLPSGLFIS